MTDDDALPAWGFGARRAFRVLVRAWVAIALVALVARVADVHEGLAPVMVPIGWAVAAGLVVSGLAWLAGEVVAGYR